MTRQKLTSFFILVVFLFASQTAFSQVEKKMKRSVATMIFSSLGGAVLGLSTLPFYGQPEEHANNITIGALVGFLAGAGYVAYDSSRPQAPAYEYTQTVAPESEMQKAPIHLTGAPLVLNLAFDF